MSEYEKLHQRISQLVERNEQLGAELECALGDLKAAKGIIDRLQKDADRYQFLRRDVSHRVSDFCIVKKFWGGTMPDRIIEGDDADLEIDNELQSELS